METQKLKPGKWLYLIGVLLIVAGIAVSVALAVVGGISAMAGAQKVKVPGSTTLTLPKAGAYSLAFVYGADGKVITDASAYKGMRLTVTGAGGEAVKVLSPSGSAKAFTITKPGSYTIAAVYAGGTGPSATMLLISAAGINGTLIRVLFWVFLILGAAVIVATAVLRHKNKKLLAA